MTSKLLVPALGVLLLIASFWTKEAFDIQLYDTYFVVGWGLLLRLAGFLCCLIGGLSFLGKRPVNRQR